MMLSERVFIVFLPRPSLHVKSHRPHKANRAGEAQLKVCFPLQRSLDVFKNNAHMNFQKFIAFGIVPKLYTFDTVRVNH